MSLNIYTKLEDLPDTMEFINYNDIFFNGELLHDNAITKKILKDIDKAIYNSATTFIGRDKSLGAIYNEHLSTGCKTLLNIANNPDKCFDVFECGPNALEELSYIKNGNILWRLPVLNCDNNYDCDIIIKNKHFNKFLDFLHYTMDEME